MDKEIQTFNTGSTLLDCVIGGGWPVGGIICVTGDSSSGKTQIVMEAAANHLLKWSDSNVYMTEKEPSFDAGYFGSLGIPVDRIEFQDEIVTIEDWFKHLVKVIDDSDGSVPTLIILDSFDSLSDDDEMERAIDKGTMGAAKAKKASEILRRTTHLMEDKNITTIIVQQLRDVINSPVPMKKPSGGKAPEYYSGLNLRLSTKNKIKRAPKGIERIVGVEVRAQCTKSKVGKPWRECLFNIMFDYGIDDITSNLEWLSTAAILKEFDGLSQVTPVDGMEVDAKNITAFVKKILSQSTEEVRTKQQEIAVITKQVWDQVDTLFAVKHSKY